MIVALCSGEGTTLAALADRGARITDVITNVAGAPAGTVAQRHGVMNHCVPHASYSTRAEHETAVLQALKHSCQPFRMIFLLGYMRILSEGFLKTIHKLWPDVVVANLHPAPLSAYKGAHGLRHALERRFPLWGVSVHEVTPELDSGPLLAYRHFKVRPTDEWTTLRATARANEIESVLEAIDLIQRRAQR